MRFAIACCSLTMLLCPACDDPEADAAEFADDGAALRPWTGGGGSGGVYMNTSSLSAHHVAGIDTTGLWYAGVRLKEVKVKVAGKYHLLDKVWSEDGQLFGKRGATVYAGAQLLDSRWAFDLDDDLFPASSVTMWIGSYSGAGDQHRYDFKYQGGTGVSSLCKPDPTGSTQAVVLGELSVNQSTGDVSARANTLYIACGAGAVGKAISWGYLPWDIGLADFEAAVRVVRADYCGDGVSWTEPGTPIQIADVWSYNSFAVSDSPVEALWGTSGALCVTQPRLAAVTAGAVTCGGVPLPACDATDTLQTRADSLLWSRTAPQ